MSVSPDDWPKHCGEFMVRRVVLIRQPEIWLQCEVCGAAKDMEVDEYYMRNGKREPSWADPRNKRPVK